MFENLKFLLPIGVENTFKFISSKMAHPAPQMTKSRIVELKLIMLVMTLGNDGYCGHNEFVKKIE